jgi:rubredoxin
MASYTIQRHTCDHCGLVFDESKESGFIPSGGPKNWSKWDKVINPVKKAGTPSYFYSTTNSSLEFCNYDCAIEWMQKEKERFP